MQYSSDTILIATARTITLQVLIIIIVEKIPISRMKHGYKLQQAMLLNLAKITFSTRFASVHLKHLTQLLEIIS